MESRTPLDVQDVVKLTSTFHSRVLANLSRVPLEAAKYWIDHPNELGQGLSFLQQVPDWVSPYVVVQEKALRGFFGRRLAKTFDFGFFRQTLEHYGEEQILEWRGLGLEPCFLPNVVFTPDSHFPGWKIKLEKRYWDALSAGKLKRRNAAGELEIVKEANLGGIVAVADVRCEPPYEDGRQMYKDDEQFMGEIIAQLREDGLIERYQRGPQASRFGASADEWQNQIRPKVAERLKLKPDQVMLEPALVANAISQLYQHMPRAKDGTTNTWVWYEEFFGGLAFRLYGGFSVFGGLSSVSYFGPVPHWYSRAVRPLGVLATLPSGA